MAKRLKKKGMTFRLHHPSLWGVKAQRGPEGRGQEKQDCPSSSLSLSLAFRDGVGGSCPRL